MVTFEDLMDAVNSELSYELQSLDSVWQEHLVLEDALRYWKEKQNLSDEDVLDEDQATDLMEDLASYLNEYEDFENEPIYTSDIYDIWKDNVNECEKAFFSNMSFSDCGSISKAIDQAVSLFCRDKARENLYDAYEKVSNYEYTFKFTLDFEQD